MTVYTAVKHTFHTAAILTADGTALPLAGLATIGIQVEGVIGDTVTFEGTIDGATWYAVQAMNVADGTVATTATADGIYIASVAGLDTFRARLTRVGGTVTVTSRAISGGAPNFADVAISGAAAVDVSDRAARDLGKVDIAAFDVALPAGEAHIGQVGGAVTTVTVTPTLTIAGAYTAGDFVGTSATPLTFANAVRVSGGSGVIESAILVDGDLQSVSAELWLFDTTIAPPNDNAAWTITDANALTCIGVVSFGTYYASALNSVAIARGLGLAFKAVGTSLFGALVTRGAPTYVSGNLSIRLVVMQD